MSEYQYVGFRAVDGPVTEKNLEYMGRQSTRAEITPWEFDNEYHFGDFRGNAPEMLRRGYDIHLHYANFGTRRLMIRLPNGLPDPKVARKYMDGDSLKFTKDKSGKGGILYCEPWHESGDLEDLWNPDELLDDLVPLRGEIQEGDLRPLFLAHLAIVCDGNHDWEELRQTPIPAGLSKLTKAQSALADFYGLGESLIAAAARNNTSTLPRKNSTGDHHAWIELQPEAQKNAWLARLLADPQSAVRAEILAEFRTSLTNGAWPVETIEWSVERLNAEAEKIRREKDRKNSQAAARKRTKELAAMAADPQPTLAETERLVKERTQHAYKKIAELLSDLREALAGSDRLELAQEQARKLKDANPKFHMLTSELRHAGFLQKTAAK